MIRQIVSFFADSGYRDMYHLMMKSLVKNVGLLSDSHPSGGYWHDISSSVNNVVIIKKIIYLRFS